MFGSELTIPVLDLIIIIAYLLGILFVGVYSVRRMKLTSQGYFLAGRSLPFEQYFKHIGVYAYRQGGQRRFFNAPAGPGNTAHILEAATLVANVAAS